MSGSEETFRFVRAYAAASLDVRHRVLRLSPFGNDDAHAIVDLVQAEVDVLRDFDERIRAIPASELEKAVHRYWANCMGQEGSLYERGSRFNHSCAANCTRVTLDGGGAERAFVTLRPVAAGEELTLSYLPSGMEIMGTVLRRRHIWLSRGFLCHCDRCSQPQDEVRQVKCPECCTDRRQQRSRAGVVSGSESPEALNHGCYGAGRIARWPAPKESAAYADWWNQSRMWVCRYCGWCSDADSGTPRLGRKEGILSAEVFALVMANTLARSPPRAPRPCRPGFSAPGGAITASGEEGGSLQGAGEERRDRVQGLLKASVALLGSRHWATFSCTLLRLEQELSALSEKPEGPWPWSTPAPPLPKAKTRFLDWAMQELNALWQWLSMAVETATSHPPAYYLFDVVCDLLRLGEESGDTKERRRDLVRRVEPWVSAFADEEQRRRFATAMGGLSSDNRASRSTFTS
eukprot:g5087.t1